MTYLTDLTSCSFPSHMCSTMLISAIDVPAAWTDLVQLEIDASVNVEIES